MLRKNIGLIALILLVFTFSACQAESETEEANVIDEQANPTEETDNTKDKDETTAEQTEAPANLDVAELFKQMAEVAKSIESISGEAITQTIDGDSPDGDQWNFSLKSIYEPFIFHADIETELEGEKMEWYANESSMYMFIEELGWIETQEPMFLQIVYNNYRDDHFLHFMNYADYFQLKDDGNYYTITYTGGEEYFKEVFYSSELFEKIFKNAEALISMIADMEYDGEISMKVDKDSLFVMEHEATIHTVIHTFGVTSETTDHSIHTFTYNDVEPFTIPNDVIENATTFGGEGMFGDFFEGDIDFGDFDFDDLPFRDIPFDLETE